MRLLAHISDLHFGHEDTHVAEALLHDLQEAAPALIAVSGDLTQRARTIEFINARNYLDRLPAQHLVVPGNHDMPLYNILHRLARPLERYCKYITADLSPCFQDDEIAVLGINTARPLNWKNGDISIKQIGELRNKLRLLSPTTFKVLVTHHQFIPPPGKKAKDLIGQAAIALKDLAEGGVDLLLAGHLHLGYSGDVRTHYPLTRRSILVAQAGTAISTRHRGEPNTYNLIKIEPDHLTITVRGWNGKKFHELLTTQYLRKDHEWHRQ